MKLFLSWSGDRSKALANALKAWLPLILYYVEPWVSESDIDAGARWSDEVAKQLDGCNFGILCVTRENVIAPWILFEAGALAKMLDGSKLIPLLFDLEFSEITGPLAQFQGKKAERNGLLEVVSSINAMSSVKVPDERYRQLFDALYPQLEASLNAIPKSVDVTKRSRPQSEVIEDLVTAVRSMETRMREGFDEPGPRYRGRRMHPEFMYELMHTVGEDSGDPVLLLVLAGAYREDYPWLSEILLETHRAYNAGDIEAARNLLEKFMVASKMARRLVPRGEVILKDQDFLIEKFLPQLVRRLADPAGFEKFRLQGMKLP